MSICLGNTRHIHTGSLTSFVSVVVTCLQNTKVIQELSGLWCKVFRGSLDLESQDLKLDIKLNVYPANNIANSVLKIVHEYHFE